MSVETLETVYLLAAAKENMPAVEEANDSELYENVVKRLKKEKM